jgi:hypothetical protein
MLRTELCAPRGANTPNGFITNPVPGPLRTVRVEHCLGGAGRHIQFLPIGAVHHRAHQRPVRIAALRQGPLVALDPFDPQRAAAAETLRRNGWPPY